MSIGAPCPPRNPAVVVIASLLLAVGSGALPVTREFVYTEIVELTLPDATTVPAASGLVLPASLPWIGLRAEELAGSAQDVLFQYNCEGVWQDIDVDDDSDFYVSLDGVDGFQARGADEIFLDDGDYVFGPGDVCLWDGGNGVVDTPLATPLNPLAGEDGNNGTDDDGDGLVDEDGSEDPRDLAEPFFVYFDMSVLSPPGDRYLLLRAVAADSLGQSDPPGAPTLVLLIDFQDPPVTDVVRVSNAAGELLDVWPPVFDGDGVDLVGSSTSDSLLLIDAIAASPLPIVSVDLCWRWSPSCYPALPPEQNPWRSLSADGFTSVDSLFPYAFSVDLARLAQTVGDGAIVFHPSATDSDGNTTPPPEDPWALRVFTNHAWITTPMPGSVSVGEEFLLTALLTDPAPAVVTFWFAERIVDVALDPGSVALVPPYLAEPLDPPMAPGICAGDQAELRVNGVEARWHADLTGLANPTKFDWTVTGGAVEFGGRPDVTDTIDLSYNTTDYMQIGEPVVGPPFPGGWSLAMGGVPEPSSATTDGYDLIATAAIDSTSGDICGLSETEVSERALLWLDPAAGVHGPQRADAGLGLMLPSPYRPGEQIVLRGQPRVAQVTLDVLSPEGRRLRRLSGQTGCDGRLVFRWDGALSDGRAASTGMYILAPSDGQVRLARRFLYVR